MSDANNVHLIGTVDANPALGETTRGVKTLNFWVKTVDKDKRVARHKVVAWGTLARERVWRRGDRVIVHGDLQYRIYRSRHGGQPVTVTDIVAHRIEPSS